MNDKDIENIQGKIGFAVGVNLIGTGVIVASGCRSIIPALLGLAAGVLVWMMDPRHRTPRT
jgi:hypothetical protein